ncbi:unnamed protein product [Rhodiola kirilowii]
MAELAASTVVVLSLSGSASSQLVSGGYSTPACCRSLWRTEPKKQRRNFKASQQYTDDKSRVYKELGLFSLKKKIEDVVHRAERLGPSALELEESKCIEQQEMIQDNNLWDDLAGSSEIFVNLAGTTKLVDALKDLKYKAEEAKLITELAEMDAINYGLFKQAYEASIHVSKFLDQYEMAKLMRGAYDIEGASVIITAGNQSVYSEAWVEQLLSMYTKWAAKRGFKGRLVDMNSSSGSGLKSATIDLEFQFAYGYLAGEKGIHRMISSYSETVHEIWLPCLLQAAVACVDVIPVFLNLAPDLKIADEDVMITSTSSQGESHEKARHGIYVQHIPTDISVNCSGERNHFANKMKALNRMNAKLLVIAGEQAVSDVRSIKKNKIIDIWQVDVRRYVFHPYKLVHDLRTGLEFPDLNSILEGHIEPLIAAHINCRQSADLA